MVIIDELDRCKPLFTLELIEKIKHFFSVKGLTFILVANLEQLESSVRSAYGDIDATTYLEKFYHLRMLFPVKNGTTPEENNVIYVQYLFKSMFDDIPEDIYRDYQEIAEHFCRVHRLSLRAIQRILSYLAIAFISRRTINYVPHVMMVLAIMKVINHSLYNLARLDEMTESDVATFCQYDKWRPENDQNTMAPLGEFCLNVWSAVFRARQDFPAGRNFYTYLENHGVRQPRKLIREYCMVLDGFSFPRLAR